jgi:peptidoglycan/xylan/chitin deacetylase (PgdA/CDA1 family)
MSDVQRRVKTFIRAHSSIVGSVLSVRTELPVVVLTYDDGPEPRSTESVLEALRERGTTATFFILVGRARRHPGLLADVVAAGHEIALHGADHRALTDFPRSAVVRRTADAKAELEDLAGRRVRWLRPPYGRQTLATWSAVRSNGLEPVLWGPTTFDSRDISQESRVAQALVGARPGAILLAHDGYADASDGVDDGPAPRLDRGDLIRRVLDAYAERGLSGSSLADALRHGSVVRGAWFGR